MRVAIYARVSTDRQGRDQTIASQLTALHDWVQTQQYTLLPEHIYTDEGFSGARLDRPALDALRDAAVAGAFDAVAVYTPDRLARKYAYQVLLLEELRRAGCQVVFLHRPISDDPHDQLLLQIQGAIAEYERAVLSERMRRGKLQQARAGHWIGGKAPYGYTYIPHHNGVRGHLVVDEGEAEFVRLLYRWLIDEHLTIRQILGRLNAGPWRPRSGKATWAAAVVHHILTDPVYTGTAYANRYHFVPPQKPRSPRGSHTGENSCRHPRAREDWIPITVPALIDAATYAQAQEQLARNATLSFRNNTKYSYLLRCLLTCKTCGLAMYGTTYKATATQPQRQYYECHGKDLILSGRDTCCPQRIARAEELEAAVWAEVVRLLQDPAQLLAQFQEFAAAATAGDAAQQEAAQKRDLQLKRLAREEQRLIDAYQAEVVSLAELSQRRQALAERRQILRAEQEQQVRAAQEAAQTQQVLRDVETFCAQVAGRLASVSFTEKQAILQLVIERVIVGEDTLEIRHVIPLRGGAPGPSGPEPAKVELCSDSLALAALPGHAPEHRPPRRGQAFMGITGQQSHAPQAPRYQPAQELPPMDFGLRERHRHPQHRPLAGPVNAHRDQHGHIAHRPRDAHLLIAGIQHHIRALAQRAAAPGRQGRIEFGGSAADLGTGHLTAAQLLDNGGDFARADALDIHLGQHQAQGAFTAQVLGQGLGIEAAVTHLGHGEGQIPQAGLDGLGLEAVGVAAAVGRALVTAGAQVGLAFGAHRSVNEQGQQGGQRLPALRLDEFEPCGRYGIMHLFGHGCLLFGV
jgi:site-specific DNA recombinase